ncbi:LysE family translocator [Robertkochia aurantiaca]|uniref:LysE family translocator n=1 Tax=Robertkochia aurantiaca TaxID=2873700 RepID=UPI001CCA844F|nr:LysE family translocator [Robertkochia sp. 3YJGBD-33]
MNPEILYAFVVSSALLAISPGPDNIFVMMQSMAHGFRYALATIAGLMSGCIIHTALVAFGVSALIRESELLFTGIKTVGAAYLLFLAYRVFKSRERISIAQSHVPRKGLAALFGQGFMMNVLNPKVSVFFLAFFPGFLFSDSLSAVYQFFILGGLFIVVSFFIFTLIALLADKIAFYLNRHKNAGVFFSWLQVVVFCGIAVFLLLG